MGLIAMFKNLANLFKNWFARTPQQASQPYIPQPPEQTDPSSMPPRRQSQDQTPPNDVCYRETVANERRIWGTSIVFGENSSVVMDNQQEAMEFHGQRSYILGSGRVVSHMEPTFVGDQLMPGVGGICYFCRLEALTALQSGLITPQEAELQSLFDTESASQCDGCGRRDVCTRHSRLYPAPDGQTMHLCVACAEAAQRGQWMRQALDILLQPFLEDEPPSPDQKEGQS